MRNYILFVAMLTVLTFFIEFYFFAFYYKTYNELVTVPQLASFKLDFGLGALLNT